MPLQPSRKLNIFMCCSTIGLQRAQKGPCHSSLFLPALAPVAACIKFRTLMIANRTTTGSAPAYFHSLMTIYIPSRSLRSVSERRLMIPSQGRTTSLFRTFSFTVPGWWNELHTPIRNAESLTIFKRHLKTHIFHIHLTSAPFS